jgi:microcystin-dependent protein
VIGLRNRNQLSGAIREEFENIVAQIRAFWLVEHNEDGTHRTVDTTLTQVPVGGMMERGTATAPTGWLLCDGTQVSRLDYKGLFDVIGTTFGAGDGSTTFTLPDFRGKFALGKAAAGTGSSLAATGGAIDHTHTGPSHTHTGPSHTHAAGTLAGPSHTHTGPSHSHGGSTGSYNINTDFTPEQVDENYDGVTSNVVGGIDPTSHSHSISADGTGNTGASGTGAVTGSTAAEGTGATGASGTGNTGTNNPPFLVINKIIFTGRA